MMASSSGLMPSFQIQTDLRFFSTITNRVTNNAWATSVYILASLISGHHGKQEYNFSLLLINLLTWHLIWTLCIYGSTDVFAAGAHICGQHALVVLRGPKMHRRHN